MSKVRLYVEGGGSSTELHSRCQEGFRKLLEQSGFQGRVPRIVACGSRNEAFSSFEIAHRQANGAYYVALLVDSEDVVGDVEKPWDHLQARDGWTRPAGARDDQVFLMTTCMETWIVADRAALRLHYKNLQETGLPALANLEQRDRHAVQNALTHATRNCTNTYAKDKRSFGILAGLNPVTLQTHLPAFARMLRVLNTKLPVTNR